MSSVLEVASVPEVVEAVPRIFPFSLQVLQLVPVMPPVAPPVVGPLGAPVVVPVLQVRFPVVVHPVWRLRAVACRGDLGQLGSQGIETQFQFEEDLFGESSR